MMKSHTPKLNTQPGTPSRTDRGVATTGLGIALVIAVLTYVVMAHQGASHVLSVAVGVAAFIVIGGGSGFGGRQHRRS